MRSKWPLMMVLGVMLFLQGCETIKGTVMGAAAGGSKGIKKDWQSIKSSEKWIDENLW
jgi:hypothetical protein